MRREYSTNKKFTFLTIDCQSIAYIKYMAVTIMQQRERERESNLNVVYKMKLRLKFKNPLIALPVMKTATLLCLTRSKVDCILNCAISFILLI